MDGQEFFQLNETNPEKCRELQKLSENVQAEWELQSVSIYSPGRVDDKEEIFRQVMSPLHFDEEGGEFKASLFSDVKDKGLSVNRGSHTTIDFIEAALAGKVAKANSNPDRQGDRYPWGLLPFSSSTIRSIYSTASDGVKRRGFGIFDTANSQDQSHADVCQLVPEGAQARSIRKSLLDIANAWLKNRSNP